MVYEASLQPKMAARGLLNPEKPVWHIKDAAVVKTLVRNLRELLERADEFGCADEIDWLCEGLILKSLIGAVRPLAGIYEKEIEAIRAYVEEHYLETHDFVQLARKQGLSHATFRRAWERYVGPPPARYVMLLRLQQACRLLAETRQSIAEVAAAVKFNYPVYFSKRFRETYGLKASAYRRQQQLTAPQKKGAS